MLLCTSYLEVEIPRGTVPGTPPPTPPSLYISIAILTVLYCGRAQLLSDTVRLDVVSSTANEANLCFVLREAVVPIRADGGGSATRRRATAYLYDVQH
jgi:hypothetical protein